MKKLNKSGFVLAETLVVTVFLLILFTMIYNNFIPLIAEYERRDNYDDIDGKYSAFWIKKIIESDAYSINGTKNSKLKEQLESKGFARFECSDLDRDSMQRKICGGLMNALEVDGCSDKGDLCNIFVTYYRLDGVVPSFKKSVLNENYKNSDIYSADPTSPNTCKSNTTYDSYCKCVYYGNAASEDTKGLCKSNGKAFKSLFKDYVLAIPDYINPSLNYAKYRIVIMYRHKKGGNNYYSFSTIEVNK